MRAAPNASETGISADLGPLRNFRCPASHLPIAVRLDADDRILSRWRKNIKNLYVCVKYHFGSVPFQNMNGEKMNIDDAMPA